jgi:hypothetical protein
MIHENLLFVCMNIVPGAETETERQRDRERDVGGERSKVNGISNESEYEDHVFTFL